MNEHKVMFYERGEARAFAMRRMAQVPSVEHKCTFSDIHFEVTGVQWCLDEDATERGTLVNVFMVRLGATAQRQGGE
jgi:hypothetical protein